MCLLHLALIGASAGLLFQPTPIHFVATRREVLRPVSNTRLQQNWKLSCVTPPSLGPLTVAATKGVRRGRMLSLAAEAEQGDFLSRFRTVSAGFCNLFPLWIVVTALVGLLSPEVFLRVSTKYFTRLIGLLMLCMGITLSVNDFKRVLTRPAITVLAFVGCYGLLPVLAILLSKALALPPSLSAGLVLLSSINGAQASNLCNFIAKGDVALSVLMTTFQTIGAIVMTPLVAKVTLGTVVPVNAPAVALSTAQVVLVPICLGMLINKTFPRWVARVLPFSPIVGVLVTCLLVGSAVSYPSVIPTEHATKLHIVTCSSPRML